ncbi:MAG: PEP-CTERM sorting domain-containing protein [Cyanosarcina radialis HA8281-LM2]|jgi:hypothetical protein|nr:PEP-CTERM sorting domain-containing protein [Cyanosarcina radialis HA8281-LM2]
MTNYRLFKVPIFASILLVEILGSSLAPAVAASLNLGNTPINCEESPTSNQPRDKDIDKFLPKPAEQTSVGAGESNAPGGGEDSAPEQPNILAANTDASETAPDPLAQIPPNAIAQGEACELVEGQVCGTGGELCDIAGPPAVGSPLVAGAAGFPLAALLPLAGVPFLFGDGGGGGGNNPPGPGPGPGPEPIPEPSTIFGSAIALGLVLGMKKKSKRSKKERSNDKTQED